MDSAFYENALKKFSPGKQKDVGINIAEKNRHEKGRERKMF